MLQISSLQKGCICFADEHKNVWVAFLFPFEVLICGCGLTSVNKCPLKGNEVLSCVRVSHATISSSLTYKAFERVQRSVLKSHSTHLIRKMPQKHIKIFSSKDEFTCTITSRNVSKFKNFLM